MRGRKKKWAIPFLDEHKEIALDSINKDDEFFKAPHLYLEVGIGKGDFIIDRCKHLDGSFLGLERDRNIAAIASKKALENECSNIRVAATDFDFIYSELEGLKFDIIYLNFSDPWPKRRHWKRRLTTRGRLSQMANLLKDDGRIIVKTDQTCLYEFTLEEAKEAKLDIVEFTDDYILDENNDSMSEYERLFRSRGEKINRIVIRKVK